MLLMWLTKIHPSLIPMIQGKKSKNLQINRRKRHLCLEILKNSRCSSNHWHKKWSWMIEFCHIQKNKSKLWLPSSKAKRKNPKLRDANSIRKGYLALRWKMNWDLRGRGFRRFGNRN